MELHVIWFIIPFILLCGIVYSVLRGYIYGAVLAALSLLAALINLVYYIARIMGSRPLVASSRIRSLG